MAEKEIHCCTEIRFLGLWLSKFNIFLPPALPAESYKVLDLLF
jgi:hypothetical protein